MMHWGHANALRQAKMHGDYLIVGVHSDSEIHRHKGPPVMNEAERYAAVRACKWVDEIVEDAPYVTQLSMMDDYKADYCVHGDDASTDADGNDTYAEVKAAGRFKVVRRTSHVSTTDLVGRMLLMTRSRTLSNGSSVDHMDESDLYSLGVLKNFVANDIAVWNYDSTSDSFSSMPELPYETQSPRVPKIVYIDGSFDLFHPAHADSLAQAHRLGNYVIVGIHSDDTVSEKMDENNRPIQRLMERALSVAACKFVDRIIMNAPFQLTKDYLIKLGVQVVARGSTSDYDSPNGSSTCQGILHAYAVPKEMGIYHEFKATFPGLTSSSIISRIIRNRLQFEQRNKKKLQKELALNPDYQP